MAAEMLINFGGKTIMICPACASEKEMAYSVLSYSFICLEDDCGFEVEMEPIQAQDALEPEEELVCC